MIVDALKSLLLAFASKFLSMPPFFGQTPRQKSIFERLSKKCAENVEFLVGFCANDPPGLYYRTMGLARADRD
jgi:hypothetical protein